MPLFALDAPATLKPSTNPSCSSGASGLLPGRGQRQEILLPRPQSQPRPRRQQIELLVPGGHGDAGGSQDQVSFIMFLSL